MPNINAALGVAQMENIEKYINNKRNTANKYAEFFETNNQLNNSTIKSIEEPAQSRSNYWLNAILLPNKEERNEFLKKTNEDGIKTRPVWKLMTKLDMFRHCEKGGLSNAEWFEERVVNLPSSFRAHS
jgi:dTDP-4-amino-4,6-dideoxygalactose transaminase